MSERRFILRTDAIRAHVQAFIGKLGVEPLMEVVVRPYVEKRSLEQNARLWKLHTLAAEYVGCTAEDMHEEMLCKFFGYTEKKMPTGWVKRVPLKRSSTREKAEFRKFLDDVENFYASEFGCWLGQEQAA